MKDSRRRRPSPALIISIIALVMAMGGTAVAAKHYLLTSTKQISPKLLKSLKGKNGKNGTNGVNGTNGAPGGRGPSDGYHAINGTFTTGALSVSVTVPAGSYLATGSGYAQNSTNTTSYPTAEGEASCTLTSAPDTGGNTQSYTTVPSHGFASDFLSFHSRGGTAILGQSSAFSLPGGGTITFTCSDAPAGTQPSALGYGDMHLNATQVGTLH